MSGFTNTHRHGSAEWFAAQQNGRLRDSVEYQRARKADNDMTAMLAAIEHGLAVALASNTGLCEWYWDSNVAAEMVLRYIVSCPPVPR